VGGRQSPCPRPNKAPRPDTPHCCKSHLSANYAICLLPQSYRSSVSYGRSHTRTATATSAKKRKSLCIPYSFESQPAPAPAPWPSSPFSARLLMHILSSQRDRGDRSNPLCASAWTEASRQWLLYAANRHSCKSSERAPLPRSVGVGGGLLSGLAQMIDHLSSLTKRQCGVAWHDTMGSFTPYQPLRLLNLIHQSSLHISVHIRTSVRLRAPPSVHAFFYPRSQPSRGCG
jgi:hypothetical protein